MLVTGLAWEQDEATRGAMLSTTPSGPSTAPSRPWSGWFPPAAEQVAREVAKLTERPRPVLVVPCWRGPMLRVFDLFPRLTLRLLPLLMRDGRRKQRRYKRLIQAGRWP